ncbi:sugar ABC transporter ATP-binding protein [Shinella sp. 838]|uniref:sugar ABC transporter ATP-binding protein n=1 Tax=Shinella sp. 838 TaxID=3038164 RepID=UPI002415630A|nr:sugar ABC transporter ATP-binding protein [Shinella sp. 838]MDG4674912.1 sugar ABC transporter ATP-binding protein [Shinella sp. 838]
MARAMPGTAPLLSLEAIKKTFPSGTVALRGVDFAASAGRIHGLLGANGAGKSTLIKILSASIPSSGGVMRWKGREVAFATPLAANRAGIATIHQNIPLVPTLSVIENVFLWKSGGWRQTSRDRATFAELTDEIGYWIDPDQLIADLSIGARQMVCILQALSYNADLIVMDEPTASLAKGEREIVYATVRRLADRGKSIIFVSHFLDEIMDLTDDVTVLRDGVTVMKANTADVSESAIAEAIAGRTVGTLEHLSEMRGTIRDELVLERIGVSSPEGLAPTDLTLRAGEVLGIAGLLGSGRSELVHAIFGSDGSATGEVRFLGRPRPKSPRASVRAGMALVPEDRDQQAIIPVFEIWKNTSLPYLDMTAKGGWLLDRKMGMSWAEEAISILKIKADSPETFVTELSGGNAQKVTVARWLFGKPRLLILDEPTAGIDVGAKADILMLVRKLAAEGVAIILVSSEFEEILAVADRVLVMRDGAIVAERLAKDTDDQELILLSSGKSENQATSMKPQPKMGLKHV